MKAKLLAPHTGIVVVRSFLYIYYFVNKKKIFYIHKSKTQIIDYQYMNFVLMQFQNPAKLGHLIIDSSFYENFDLSASKVRVLS